MIKLNISRVIPFFFLARRVIILPQIHKERNSLDNNIFYKTMKSNYSKTESKRAISQNKEKTQNRTYYKFLCKCQAGFNSFPEFLGHVKTFHEIKNLNFTEIFAKNTKKNWEIKFYWHLSCQCSHKFSSSLCNSDLKVDKEQIEITKKYRLQCLKCKKYAKFDEEELLDEFLKDRIKQKLIYNFYWQEFAKFEGEWNSEKILEGHIQELCEKCKLLGRHCGELSQEQISQIRYTPPFLKW